MDAWLTHALLEGHPYVFRSCGGDPNGFLKEFRSAWSLLPTEVREKILQFWASRPYPPIIELSDVWSPKAAVGQVRHTGQELKFRAECFLLFRTKAAQWIIAHELAHLYQKALGRPPGGESEEKNEAEANEFARSWGFDDSEANLLVFYASMHDVPWSEACSVIYGILPDGRQPRRKSKPQP